MNKNKLSALLLLAALLAIGEPSQAKDEPVFAFGMKADCPYANNRSHELPQSCLSLRELSVSWHQRLGESLKVYAKLDPFISPKGPLYTVPRLGEQKDADEKKVVTSLLADFGAYWSPSAVVGLSVSRFHGTTIIPPATPLAFASPLQAYPWGQTALGFHFAFPGDRHHEMALYWGSGEGENFQNHDPQQFAALGWKLNLASGLYFQGGYSFDGNSQGSEQTEWILEEAEAPSSAKKGFSTERFMAALVLDGERADARGLKVSLGWQQVLQKDLNKSEISIDPGVYQNTKTPWDLQDIFIEDPLGEKANTVQQDVLSLQLSYLILAQHFVALSYESLQKKSKDVAFFKTVNGTQQRTLGAKAFTVGMGSQFDELLGVSLEWHHRRLDRDYQEFHFPGRKGQSVKSLNLINLRISCDLS